MLRGEERIVYTILSEIGYPEIIPRSSHLVLVPQYTLLPPPLIVNYCLILTDRDFLGSLNNNKKTLDASSKFLAHN